MEPWKSMEALHLVASCCLLLTSITPCPGPPFHLAGHELIYLVSFTKYHSNLKLYSDFRNKMISEENLIMSNLNIDKILKEQEDYGD